MKLTVALTSGYTFPVTGSPVAGFSSLRKAAKSRNVSRIAAFLRLVSPFMGGLGGEPQGSPVRFPGLLTRPVPSTRLAAGVRLNDLKESEYTMTTATQGASAPIINDTTSQELVVVLNPHDLDFSEYRGTRAQLEAEGVIPSGTKWPVAYSDLRWKSGKLDFWLRRMRPMGAKGARKLFIDCDYWNLRWELSIQPCFAEKEIHRKCRELDAAVYRASAKGIAEMNKRVDRYLAARFDEKFQAFKALIPCPVAAKRGRPAKNTIQSQGESA